MGQSQAEPLSEAYAFRQVKRPWFFGQWLVDSQVITADQLSSALSLSMKRNRRLGELAVSKGYLTPQEVVQIHRKQREHDAKFGELAEKLGLLSRVQVLELLRAQENGHVRIGQALVELGILSLEAVREQLELFTAAHEGLSAASLVPVPFVDNLLCVELVDLIPKMVRRVAGTPGKLAPGDQWDGSLRDHTLSLDINGDFALRATLSCCLAQAAAFTRGVLQMEADEEVDDELVTDALGELMNVIAGTAKNSLSDRGKQVTIGLPVADSPNKPAAMFTLATPSGSGVFLVSALS